MFVEYIASVIVDKYVPSKHFRFSVFSYSYNIKIYFYGMRKKLFTLYSNIEYIIYIRLLYILRIYVAIVSLIYCLYLLIFFFLYSD